MHSSGPQGGVRLRSGQLAERKILECRIGSAGYARLLLPLLTDGVIFDFLLSYLVSSLPLLASCVFPGLMVVLVPYNNLYPAHSVLNLFTLTRQRASIYVQDVELSSLSSIFMVDPLGSSANRYFCCCSLP
jgi:hypothetical protein